LRLVLQLLGTNAAGKSSLIRAIVGWDSTAYVDARSIGGKPVQFTACPKLGLVAVGDYKDRTHNTPGADRISPKTRLLGSLDYAVQLSTGWKQPIVAWEGIIIQTRQYLPEYQQRGLTPLFVYLAVPADTAFARIELRSGKTRAQLSGNGKIILGRIITSLNIVSWAHEQKQSTMILDGREPLERLAEKVMAELVRLRARD